MPSAAAANGAGVGVGVGGGSERIDRAVQREQFSLFFSTGHVLRFSLAAEERPACCLALLLGRYSAHLAAAALAAEGALVAAAAGPSSAENATAPVLPVHGDIFDADDPTTAAAAAASGAAANDAARHTNAGLGDHGGSGRPGAMEGTLLLQHVGGLP